MQARWIWASLAIVAMWTAALLISLWAPTLVTDTAAGDHVDVPAAGIVAIFFAFLATVVLALVGFRGEALVGALDHVDIHLGDGTKAAPLHQDRPVGADDIRTESGDSAANSASRRGR